MDDQDEVKNMGGNLPDADKRRITVGSFQVNQNQTWTRPFNQVIFINYDTNVGVIINSDFTLPPAQIVGGFVYPTYFQISLNQGEINTTYYKLDFKQSATAKLVIISTEYNEGLS